MGLLSFAENSPFFKSVLKQNNPTAMLKFPQNVDDSHFIRFHFIEFPDITTRQTRGPIVASDAASSRTGPKVFGKSSIFLYMPAEIAVSHGQEWETVNLGVFGKTLEEITSRGRDESLSGELKSIGKGIAGVALQAVYSITGFENLKSATTNKVLNQYKDVVYNGPQLRSFIFKWNFTPRSEADCETLKNIMDSFKFHSAPQKAKDGFLSVWNFPGAFEVSFHSYNAAFNQYLPQLGYCVATRVTSNYTPNGMFAAFRNGHPTEVEFTVEMQEIQAITRDELLKENPNSMAATMNKTNTSTAISAPSDSDNVKIYQESDLYKPVEIG